GRSVEPCDGPAAEHVLALVQYQRLAGRDGFLRLVELNVEVLARAAQRTGDFLRAVARLGHRPQRLTRRITGDPVELFEDALALEQLLRSALDHGVGGRIKRCDKKRLSSCDAKPSEFTDGEHC